MKKIRVNAILNAPSERFMVGGANKAVFSFRGDVPLEYGNRTLASIVNDRQFPVKPVICRIRNFDVPSKTLFLTGIMRSADKRHILELIRSGWKMDVEAARHHGIWTPTFLLS